MIHVPIFFRITSLALGQSYDCPSVSEGILNTVTKVLAKLIPPNMKMPRNHAHNCWNVCLWNVMYKNIQYLQYIQGLVNVNHGFFTKQTNPMFSQMNISECFACNTVIFAHYTVVKSMSHNMMLWWNAVILISHIIMHWDNELLMKCRLHVISAS